MGLALTTTLPTRDGQSVGAFLCELSEAVEKALMGRVPAHMRGESFAGMDSDSLAGEPVDSVVGYLWCAGDRRHFRFSISRGEDGAIALSDPEEVARKETVEYETVTPQPLVMSALLCDALPVHAPPAEGLTRGQPGQLLRVGPLYDALTGEFLLDVTDDLCAAIAATAAASGFAIPIDHGHALYRAQSAGQDHSAVPIFGRIVALEHRLGVGLFGTPEYNAAGVAYVEANPGTAFWSPTLMGQGHSPRDGEAMPGRAVHSASFTPTPRQDGMGSLALSQRVTGAGAPQKGTAMAEKTGAGAQNQPDVIALAAQLDTEKHERTKAEAEVLRLSQELDALKPQAEQAATLAQRVETLERETKAKDFAALCAEVKRSGRNVGERTLKLAASLPLDDARALLMEQPVTLPPGPAGHAGNVEAPKDPKDPAVIRLAVKLTNEKGIPYDDALKLAQTGAQGVA